RCPSSSRREIRAKRPRRPIEPWNNLLRRRRRSPRPVLMYRQATLQDWPGSCPLRNPIKVPEMKFKDLLSGFIRLHILHHAAEHEIYGQWIIDELARHGYKLSPGTLYPLLNAMEQRGYLKSRKQREGRTARKLYRATALGKKG